MFTRHLTFLKKMATSVAVSVTTFALTAFPAAAQSDSPGYGFRNPLGNINASVPELIGRTVLWLGGAAGSLFFLYLLWAGVEWMAAGGDPKKVSGAQKKIKAAASGIIVILFAYTVVATIINIVPR
jgi:hypothetical protein